MNREVLSGHICRCTGYAGIVAATTLSTGGGAEIQKAGAGYEQQGPIAESVTINGKNVVLAHNELPVINAGVLENADIFRMINIFAEKSA